MEHDVLMDLPGGDNFYDVTALFEDAAEDMSPGSLIFARDFTLHDAMAAFEIGEPRFDSGMALMDASRPVFDPLALLLPEEVCWIIDRSFACEMEWHSGYTLSQTIFSFLHVHSLRETEPDFIPRDQVRYTDQRRPLELITVILRASVLGLLKCCDLSWRELDKGNVYDAEDWQSEKCDVPLSEAVSVNYVLSKLDEACVWLRNSPKAQSRWRNALLQRLVLRKTLVELLSAQLAKEYHRFRSLTGTARDLIRQIRRFPPPEPGATSPALHTFDPQFARVLVSFIPLHVIQLPEQGIVWDKLLGLLESLEQASRLVEISNLSTWKIVGHLQLWSPKPNRRLPYTRSACQSALFQDGMVLNKYTQKHVADCFFRETLEISYDSFIDTLGRRWIGSTSVPLPHIERTITEIVLGYIKSLWYNPSRRRRYCMKSLFDWHDLYALLTDVQNHLTPVSGTDIVSRLRAAVLMYRFSIIREVIFSGFQLCLYSAEERVFAYWYAAQVLELHLSSLDQIAVEMPNSTTLTELRFQVVFLTALQAMSSAMFSVLLKHLGSSWQRMRLNFLRRYKWAFIDEYEDINLAPVGHPNFTKFASCCSVIPLDRDHSPAGQIELARQLLSQLATADGGWAGPWDDERRQFMQRLVEVCQSLGQLPSSMSDVDTWDVSQLKWDPEVHPWFPFISSDAST
ncbi:Mak10 subunit, NatC N-terminal acetyltransferase-domain-containing protein [Phlebopus sp. FC_14]|nr:Mak10 subunit, NatC N-terminal acetyltransferase-domain-containing protein [Phlebopus sp. FC_14]